MKWWQRVLLNTIIFLILGSFLDGVRVDNWQTALLAALMFGLLNAVVKPIVTILSLPITLVTLGLFYFVINGLIIWLTSVFVAGFTIQSFGIAILVSLIVSLANSLVMSD